MNLSTLLGAAAAAATLNLHAAPAASQYAAETARPAPAFQVVPDEELDTARGGYLLADNLAFQFGAIMRTYENGALSLQTQLVWTPDGPAFQQDAGDGVMALTGPELGAIGADGFFLTSGGAIVQHDLKAGEFMNLLLNTESGRDYRQDLAITLVLPGFESAQGDMGRQLTGLRLADELSLGAVFAIGGL